jgi:hypothetical protein
MSDRAPRLTRRNFLLTVGAGGAATAAAVVAKSVAKSPAQDAAKSTAGSSGYQASGHIRNYYRTAKV